MKAWHFFAAALCLCISSQAQTLYNSETAFQSALGTVTVVNLDGGDLAMFASGYRVEDPGPAAAFAALGIDFFDVNAQVLGGQAVQITKPDRDRLIFNGAGLDGNIAFNLLQPVDGIGAWTNVDDGGHVQAFSAPNLGGVMIGQAPFGGGSDFGGLISGQPIASVRITCEFDFDLRCGVFDIQFGNLVVDTDNDSIPDGQDNCVQLANTGQEDSNGDGYGNRCDADLNDDCVVNVLDLALLRSVFFGDDPDADFNSDGVVNVGDLGIMRTFFFMAPGPSGPGGDCD